MSSNRNKNFRRRSEGGGGDANGEDKPSPPVAPVAARPKPRPQKPEAPKRLSFADEEEEEEEAEGPTARRAPAKVRPSSSTPSLHKLSSSKDRASGKDRDRSSGAPPAPTNVHPQAGEYTEERLLELKKNARHLGSMPKPSEPKPARAEPVVVLKGLVKPPPPPIPGREKDREMPPARQHEEEEQVSDEEGDGGDVDNRQFAKLGIDGKILDSAAIKAILAKKERLRRSLGPAPDYISLDGGGVVSSRPSKGGSSDDEEDDLRGRIALFGDKKDSGAKKGVFEDMEEQAYAAEPRSVDTGLGGATDDDEDEEERIWEEQQLRKAGYRTISGDTSSSRGTNSVQPFPPIQPSPSLYSGVVHHVSSNSLPLGTSDGVTRSADVMSIPQQAEVATLALQENINKLKESHSRTMASFIRTDDNLSESLSEITALEKSLEEAGEKYIFMQQLRDFISVMCDFLKDKASLIEELEEQMQKLHEVRASTVEERRDADIADETSQVEAAVNAAISVLSKGSGSAFISAATTAAHAAAAAAAKETLNLPVQLDELGRDVNMQKRMDYTRRSEERKKRRARLESKRMMSVGKDKENKQLEGEVSTDESDGDKDAYESSRDELLQTAGQIFSDAADEYSNLSIVKDRFENWQKLYSSSYRDAYMSLSAPAIFSPFVRLELLKWDPLYSKAIFESMEWYNLLIDYGLPGEDKNLSSDEVDDNLIPELVEKVALPILHHDIEHCWDILSTRRTENAVFATDMVISYIPPSSKALHELLAVVRRRLVKAIVSLDVPSWNSIVTKAVPGAAQYAAYRFGMSVRLLRNICLWKDILPLPLLEKLALEDLLIGKLLPHVRSCMSSIHDSITRTERIVASLSGVWFGPNVTGDHSLKLQPLVECVAEMGRKLEKRHTAGVNEEETLGLARRLKTMLVQLNEYDKARAMLRTFQLKEAL